MCLTRNYKQVWKIGIDQLNLKPEKQGRVQKTRKPAKKKMQAVRRPKRDAHPFDNLVKELFGKDGAQIVPELVEGAQVVSAENVELDRSKLKADLVWSTKGHSGSPNAKMLFMILKFKRALTLILSIGYYYILQRFMSAIGV